MRETDDEIQEVITSYFDTLFSTTQTEEEFPDRYTMKKLSKQQNYELLSPISENEVKEAVFAMHPDKSPGPDGLNPAFFQTYWSIVGHDVVVFC